MKDFKSQKVHLPAANVSIIDYYKFTIHIWQRCNDTYRGRTS